MAADNVGHDKPEKVKDSQFYMIRCILAVAHADGIIHEDERAYIYKIISRLELTNDQMKTIEQDFETPQDVIEMFDKIEDPQFKSQVIHFARLMVWRDGELDPGEKEILDKLQAHASSGAGHDNLEPLVTHTLNSSAEMEYPEDKSSILSHFFGKIFGR